MLHFYDLNRDIALRVFNVQTPHTELIKSLAFSQQDGRYIYTAANDGTVRCRDASPIYEFIRSYT